MCGRWLDAVECGQSRERLLDAAECLLVVLGPVGVRSLGAEQRMQELGRRRALLRPRRSPFNHQDLSVQVLDEGHELLAINNFVAELAQLVSNRIAGVTCLQQFDALADPLRGVVDLAAPVSEIDHDTSLPRQLVPVSWADLIAAEAQRPPADHSHDPIAPPSSVRKRERAEQRPPGDRIGETARIGPVDRDLGGSKLLLDDPHIRIRGREKDPDSVESNPSLNQTDDALADLPDFLRCVGDRHNFVASRRNAGYRTHDVNAGIAH